MASPNTLKRNKEMEDLKPKMILNTDERGIRKDFRDGAPYSFVKDNGEEIVTTRAQRRLMTKKLRKEGKL